MITGKHLTIREAKNEMLKAENELDVYLTKKKINYLKTQPGSVKYKDIITSKSRDIFDRFTHYVIKDEEVDEKIYSLQETIASCQQYIVKEMKRMSDFDEIGLISYLKDEEDKSWKEIDRILHRGYDYSRKKYQRFSKKS